MAIGAFLSNPLDDDHAAPIQALLEQLTSQLRDKAAKVLGEPYFCVADHKMVDVAETLKTMEDDGKLEKLLNTTVKALLAVVQRSFDPKDKADQSVLKALTKQYTKVFTKQYAKPHSKAKKKMLQKWVEPMMVLIDVRTTYKVEGKGRKEMTTLTITGNVSVVKAANQSAQKVLKKLSKKPAKETLPELQQIEMNDPRLLKEKFEMDF